MLSLLLAVPLALLAGYRRGRTDALITRLFDLYVEVIFGLPGVGAMTANTIGTFDLPPVIALAMYLALVVVLASALVDIAVAWLDPRIRRSPA